MAEGKTNDEIIDQLGLSEEDVRSLRAESEDKTSDKFLGIDKPKVKGKKQPTNEEDDDDDDEEDSDEEDGDKKKKENPFKKEDIELIQISTNDLEIDEEVSSLLGSDQTLSEEVRDKTRILFETAVVNAVNTQLANVQEQYNDLLEAQLEEKSSELVNQVDSYMDHIIDTWMEENKLAVENGIRTELAESLINDIKEVFESHQIEIPEASVSDLEDLAEVATDLEDKLDEEIKTNISLKKEITDMKKEKAFSLVSENLTDSEVDKLVKLVSHVDYVDDDTYVTSLATIKESMFNKSTDLPEKVLNENIDTDLDTAGTNKNLNEDDSNEDKNKTSIYSKAISQSVKR